MQLVIELLLSNNNQRVRWRHERRYVLKHKPDNLQKLFARCQTVLSISPQHHTWQLVGDKERWVVGEREWRRWRRKKTRDPLSLSQNGVKMGILNDREPQDSWGNLSEMGKDCMDYDECRRERESRVGREANTRSAGARANNNALSCVEEVKAS